MASTAVPWGAKGSADPLMWQGRTGLWAVLAGAVHAVALSPMVASWGALAPATMQSLALAWLLRLLASRRSPKHVAWITWLYGSLWLVGATGWMYVSLHRYGGLPAVVAGAAVGGLCAALSLYMGLLGWVWARWRHGSWWRDALAFAGLWLLAEWARAIVFTGFPWGASGYALVDTPLARLAPWMGVYGMGAVWAGLVAAAVWSASARWLGLALALGVLCALALSPVPHFTQPHGGPMTVTLLQGNVPQDEKFLSERQGPMLIWHRDQLLAARTDLVLAPETAIPLLPSQLPPEYWERIEANFGAGTDRSALVGVPLGDFEHGYTNSVAGMGPLSARDEGGFYRYDKHHLVPFGEFIPWGFRWFVQMMNMPLGDFNRGPLVAPSFQVRDQRVAPTICYEDLFGEEIAARFVNPPLAPTVLANVSNLAWFGESVAIHQHLQIARMRSLEFQLPTLRATNTGTTGVVTHEGRIQAALATNTRGVLTASVQGREGVTPFAWWAGRWGLWPAWALGLGLVLLGRRWSGH